MFQTSATIENISTRVDKTLKITISTQELSPEEASLLMGLHQKMGWFLFKENPVTTEEVPDEPAPEFKTDKSPSRRLRACLFVFWEKNTDKSQNFQQFYENWMDKKCEEIKNYL